MTGSHTVATPEGPTGTRRLRVALGALGICVGGFVAGLLGVFVVRAAVAVGGVADLTAVQLLSSNYIQFGFAVFVAAYLLQRSDWSRFLSVRRPTLEDVAWIAALPVAFVPVAVALNPILGALGLSDPHTGGGAGVELATNPGLWPVAFVGLYLFAAPAEEAVYRGLVQGRLRAAFDTAGVVVSGLLFGLLHGLVGILTPEVGLQGALYWALSTVPAGLLWAYAYERTRNLVVTATTHAMTWTIPVAALLGLSVH